MHAAFMHGASTVNRRRAQRVGLAVPIVLSQGIAPQGEAVPLYNGQTVNLSIGGTYARIQAEGRLVPGEVLYVSIAIPWESRRLVPLSRIAGVCRVVRIDEPVVAESEENTYRYVALAFCDSQIIQLGAIVVPG